MKSSDFDEIYREYFKDVFLYLMSLCGSKALAEELTQEAFIKAMKGKAQYTLHFYENLNFQDLAMYYGSRSPWMARTYHEEGRPFEVACICPNDKAFGAVCEICGNDERYVENTTFQSRYGYVKGPNFDYDQPNPKASEPFEDEYLTMEMEISEVVYWQFDQNSYLDVYLDMLTGHSHFRQYTVWKRY